MLHQRGRLDWNRNLLSQSRTACNTELTCQDLVSPADDVVSPEGS
jgi:hypothetical protein